MTKFTKIAALAALALGTIGGAAQVHAGPATASIDPPITFSDSDTATEGPKFVSFTLAYNGANFGRQVTSMSANTCFHATSTYRCDGSAAVNIENNAGPFCNIPDGSTTWTCAFLQPLADASTTVTVNP